MICKLKLGFIVWKKNYIILKLYYPKIYCVNEQKYA